MKTRQVTQANRAAWEEAAPLHRRQNMANLLENFREPGYSCLDPIETEVLRSFDLPGKDVAQLCCNNGRELLSVKNLGAGRCIGFDGASGFIEQARELAAAGTIDCRFVCSDVYDIEPRYNACFDILTVTIGVLGWMPDLDGFFAVANRLLRPGGAFFIYEQHPILEVFKPGAPDDPVEFEYSYFSREAIIETEGLDYYGGGTYVSKPLYSFVHKMSDIIMAGVKMGLSVEHFDERPEHISNTWYNVEKQAPYFPMSYTLVYRKPLAA